LDSDAAKMRMFAQRGIDTSEDVCLIGHERLPDRRNGWGGGLPQIVITRPRVNR
jgi:hypothetical protein